LIIIGFGNETTFSKDLTMSELMERHL